MKTPLLVILSAAFALISASPAQAAIHAFIWNSDTGMTDLGTLTPGEDSYAFGINDSGQVVGSSGPHAFIWSEETGMVDLGTPGGAVSLAFGINSSGAVVGEGDDAAGNRVAFYWTSNSGFVTLSRTGHTGIAYAISDSNWVAGYTYLGPIDDGFVWNPTRRINRPLGYLPGGNESVGYDINNLNHIVGTGRFDDAMEHLLFWTKQGGVQDLKKPPGTYHVIGKGINDNDEIVGYIDPPFETTPFYWSEATGFVMMQKLNGDSEQGYAEAINNQGQIVGQSTSQGFADFHAVLWEDSLSAPQDLGTLPNGDFSLGENINNLGQVVGWSQVSPR